MFDGTPAPRQSGSIQVKFTPRVLATPMRESRLPEEEEVHVFRFPDWTVCLFADVCGVQIQWMRKMAEAGRTPGGAAKCEDGDLSERNPLWLKDRGK